MTRILVVPEQLRALGRQLQRAADDLRGVSGRVGGAIGRLDWEARQKAGVDAQVSTARSRANALADQAAALARYLVNKAQVFEEADRQSAADLPGIPSAWSTLPVSGASQLPWPLTALPAIGLGWFKIPGILWPPKIQFRLPKISWPWRTPSETGSDNGAALISPLPKDTSPPAKQVTFGDLLKESAEHKPEAQPQDTGPAATDQSWWMDVPTRSQQGLKVPDGTPTAYGCAPTSASMVLDYWNAKDPANKTMTAQELVRVNWDEKQFQAVGGMTIMNLHDELTDLGYAAKDHVNATADDLKAVVAQGPVVAMVKLGMGTTGTNHSVVITGISEDGLVRINDPWTGKAHTYSWDQFARSWGADYGGGLNNIFTTIRPL